MLRNILSILLAAILIALPACKGGQKSKPPTEQTKQPEQAKQKSTSKKRSEIFSILGRGSFVTLSPGVFWTETPEDKPNCDDGTERLHFSIRNSKIEICCYDCCRSDTPVVKESFRLQNIAYDCLAGYLDYKPGLDDRKRPLIQYELSHLGEKVYRTVAGGCVQESVVLGSGFIGRIKNSNRVRKVEDVLMDLHGTFIAFHNTAFTNPLPTWYLQGMAIAIKETMGCIGCGPARQDRPAKGYGLIEQGHDFWQRRKAGKPLDKHHQKIFEKDNPHSGHGHLHGAMAFAALQRDYRCNMLCWAEIWKKLKQKADANKRERQSNSWTGVSTTSYGSTGALDTKKAIKAVAGPKTQHIFDILKL
ncbi:MAG: hypothetical protein HQ530_01000 [Parcubacteria group bacterium]|nr:hypothetical protein [Parcubacteria group bacterium]